MNSIKSSLKSSASKHKSVNCPTCQSSVPWIKESLFRPFCSERCKLIDFGDWANEKNSIPVEEEELVDYKIEYPQE